MRAGGCLALEWKTARRSRWTWTVLLLAICALFLTGGMTIRSMGQEEVMLSEMRRDMGDFAGWLATDPSAADMFADTQPSRGTSVFLAVLATLGPFLAAAWAAGLVGSEFAWRTSRMRAAHFGWGRTITAKMVVLLSGCACVAIFVGLLGLGFGRVMSYVISHRYPLRALVPDQGSGPALIFQIGVVFCGLSCYALLAALLVLAFRSAPAALVGAIAIAYVEGFARVWWFPANAYATLINKFISYPAGIIVGAQDPVAGSPGPWVSLAAVLGWTLVFGSAAWMVARRQQIR
jgi:ABC-type transport system involved in multi-copper enzyme maturation permease subunit